MLIVSPGSFTTWINMAQAVQEYVPGVAIFQIESHLRDAAREFFRLSRIWRSADGITLFTTVGSQSSYTYTPPTNAELAAVHAAWVGTDPLDVMEAGEGLTFDPTVTSDTFAVGARATDTFITAPAPVSAGLVVKGTVSYVPADDAVGIPTAAWNEWGKRLAAGAAARLIAMPNQRWASPNSEGALRSMFMQAVFEASNEAGPSMARPLRVKPV